MRYVRTAVGLASLAAAAACGSGPVASTGLVSGVGDPPAVSPAANLPRPELPSPPAPPPNPDYLGPVTATHDIGDQGEVWTSPNSSQSHPRATWQSIWSHRCAAASACTTPGRTTIVLARVTLPFPAKINHRNGTETREFVDRLMYVFTTTGITCTPLGGPIGAPPPKAHACVSRQYYDANTGHFWYGSSEGDATP